MSLSCWGWPDHPQGPRGGFGHPLRPHPGPWGWSGHTQQLKPIFFLGGLSGWPNHPQRPGMASATPIRPVWGGWSHPLPKNGVAGSVWGGRSHPSAKNGVVRPPHFWARGGSSHPAISHPPPLFFNFLLFFKKKKKKLKWPKLRRYGQNDVILGEPKTV
jgi:hypothetical protein